MRERKSDSQPHPAPRPVSVHLPSSVSCLCFALVLLPPPPAASLPFNTRPCVCFCCVCAAPPHVRRTPHSHALTGFDCASSPHNTHTSLPPPPTVVPFAPLSSLCFFLPPLFRRAPQQYSPHDRPSSHTTPLSPLVHSPPPVLLRLPVPPPSLASCQVAQGARCAPPRRRQRSGTPPNAPTLTAPTRNNPPKRRLKKRMRAVSHHPSLPFSFLRARAPLLFCQPHWFWCKVHEQNCLEAPRGDASARSAARLGDGGTGDDDEAAPAPRFAPSPPFKVRPQAPGLSTQRFS